MRYQEILEARSNPELNKKISTKEIFQNYINNAGSEELYVHFNRIEKVGMNYKSDNTYGPTGIYAMPISISIDYGLKNAKRFNAKYANILRPTYSNLLNLDKVDISTMQSLFQKTLAFHKKKIKNKSEFYSNFKLPTTVKECWYKISLLLNEYASRRHKNINHIMNSFFRSSGIDAIYDSSQIINDNTNQIVFLTPKSYEVIETIPLRF